jgi:hypothetical protein
VKQQHTATATSILTTKSTCRNLSAQRLSERTVLHTYPPVKMEQTECSETLAYTFQTPVNHTEESIQQQGRTSVSNSVPIYEREFH